MAAPRRPQSMTRTDRLAESSDGAGGKGTMLDVLLRKEQALLEKYETENKVRSGALVDIETVEQEFAKVAQSIRDPLLSLSQRVAPELAAITDARLVKDHLDKEIAAVMSNIRLNVEGIENSKAT